MPNDFDTKSTITLDSVTNSNYNAVTFSTIRKEQRKMNEGFS